MKTSKPEQTVPFSDADINKAIRNFLEYGEETLAGDELIPVKGHKGYFSGSGWAARCLRYHLEQRQKNHGKIA